MLIANSRWSAVIAAVRNQPGNRVGFLTACFREFRVECRPACAACCIAPSISSPIPGMPQGKPAGVPCIQLDDALRCRLFGSALRPLVCGGLRPSAEMCGSSAAEAFRHLQQLEVLTLP